MVPYSSALSLVKHVNRVKSIKWVIHWLVEKESISVVAFPTISHVNWCTFQSICWSKTKSSVCRPFHYWTCKLMHLPINEVLRVIMMELCLTLISYVQLSRRGTTWFCRLVKKESQAKPIPNFMIKWIYLLYKRL